MGVDYDTEHHLSTPPVGVSLGEYSNPSDRSMHRSRATEDHSSVSNEPSLEPSKVILCAVAQKMHAESGHGRSSIDLVRVIFEFLLVANKKCRIDSPYVFTAPPTYSLATEDRSWANNNIIPNFSLASIL